MTIWYQWGWNVSDLTPVSRCIRVSVMKQLDSSKVNSGTLQGTREDQWEFSFLKQVYVFTDGEVCDTLPVTDEVKLNSNKQRYEESIISSVVTGPQSPWHVIAGFTLLTEDRWLKIFSFISWLIFSFLFFYSCAGWWYIGTLKKVITILVLHSIAVFVRTFVFVFVLGLTIFLHIWKKACSFWPSESG
jgi:hypothetical protein